MTRQNFAPSDFEVIVVSDGSTDDTLEAARGFSALLQLLVVEQPNSGPAAARNRGAGQAHGELLVFLDDDTEPQPQFLAAHVRAHRQNPNLVLMGYLPPVLGSQRGFFRTELLGWWEVIFQRMRQPGHHFGYTDLLSGNFSLRRDLFERVGGFNPEFQCHEDYEFGVRLQQLGADFAFSDEALAFHHESSDLRRSVQRKYAEGAADVQLGRLYPYVRPALLMTRLQKYARWPSRVLQFLAFSLPGAGRTITTLLLPLLSFFDRLKAYRIWQRLLYGLLGYWYWRGVAEKMGSAREVKAFIAVGNQAANEFGTSLKVDLAEGIAHAEALLDACRPDRAQIFFKQHWIGRLPAQLGGEKLRGCHLKPLLVTDLLVPLARALAQEGVIELVPENQERFDSWCDEAYQQSDLA